MNKLVRNVIWPAVAGNILWSFLQLAVEKPEGWLALTPRLAALLFAGVYLAIDWVNAIDLELVPRYWTFDVPLAAAFATFAVATSKGGVLAPLAVSFAFAVAIAGHIAGAWDEVGKPTPKGSRAALAGINAVGLAILISARLADLSLDWATAVALFVAILLFLGLRNRIALIGPANAPAAAAPAP